MKKIITLMALCLPFGLWAQTAIPNGNFENWTSKTVDVPPPWHTSNEQTIPQTNGQVQTFFRETSMVHGGSNAIKLTTIIQGSDTFGAYMLYGLSQNPQKGQGGMPYTSRPDSFTFWYKYTPAPSSSDSAIFIVEFKKAGQVFGGTLGTLKAATNYTRFSIPNSYAFPFVTPDSVIIGFAASNLIQNIGVASGSTLYIDDVSFVGGSPNPVQNGDFETWTTQTFNFLTGWNITGDPRSNGLEKSTDAHNGSYALKLNTVMSGDGNLQPGGVTTGTNTNNGPPTGGYPYTGTSDVLTFWAKYNNNGGSDSGMIDLVFLKGGNVVGQTGMQIGNTPAYKQFSLPFTVPTAPDMLQVDIQSAGYPAKKEGSYLIIDQLQLQSQPLPNGIRVNWANSGLKVYPNPTQDNLFMLLPAGNEYSVKIFNSIGQEVFNSSGNNGFTNINVKDWKPGIYLYQVRNSTISTEGRFIKE
jgi:hypothetical protein